MASQVLNEPIAITIANSHIHHLYFFYQELIIERTLDLFHSYLSEHFSAHTRSLGTFVSVSVF